MPLYVEGILWYLLLIDCLVYNYLSWRQKKGAHWISDHWPLNQFLGLVYLILVLWLGFALYRMSIILFR